MRLARIAVLATIAVMVVALSGCDIQIGYMQRDSTAKMSATFAYMSATKTKDVELRAGDKMTLDYKADLTKGTLSVSVTGPEGATYTDTFVGPVNAQKTGVVDADRPGTYTVKVVGQDAGGSYTVTWRVTGQGR